MNFVIILFAALTVAFAEEQVQFKLPPERILKLKKLSDECAAEYNVDPNSMKKIADGTLPTDEVTNKYLYCAALKAGIIVEDGHLNVDKLASFVEGHPITEKLKESLRKCNEITKENPIATTVEMNRCVIDTAPVHFIV